MYVYIQLGVIVKVMKIVILRWLGQLCRMQEMDPCRKLTLLKTECTRLLGKPKLIWLEPVEEDLQQTGGRTADVGQWTEQSGGQFLRRLMFTKRCSATI
jgi:hypothetical protein